MDEFLNEFLCCDGKELYDLDSVNKINSEVEMNKKWLKRNLSKKQKKLLLRIEDGKNLVNEIGSTESFVAGFKLGVKVGYEVNKG